MSGRKLTIDRVMPGDVEAFEAWDALLREIFTDPDDLESTNELLDRLEQTDKNMFFLFRDENQKPVGFELVQVDPNMPLSHVGYVPWAGMIESHRNNGEYPALSRQVMNIAKAEGVACLLHEVEDPKRISVAYPDEPAQDVENIAARRFNFWRRPPLNSVMIDDGTTGDENSLTAYVRPASSDDQATQKYDLMVFRELDGNHPMFEKMYNADKTAISLESYKRLFLQMTQLQYEIDVPTTLKGEDYYTYLEVRMSKELPAVADFCGRIDKAMQQGQWMALHQGAVTLKAKPDPVHEVVLGANIKPILEQSAVEVMPIHRVNKAANLSV